ncbi:hypothetical protein TYRP_015183 [Tyrophagus putrescentiae]|nr:hypothetical protein TYRP_015183 [Tyrophagus putrescentiae]
MKTPKIAEPAKGTATPSSVTPTPTVNIPIIIATTNTPTPTTTTAGNSPIRKLRSKLQSRSPSSRQRKEKEKGEGGEPGAGESSDISASAPAATPSAIIETVLTFGKAHLGANWNLLKAVLVVVQSVALLLALYHFLLPPLSTEYQKAVLFSDPAKYGEVGVPVDGKWGAIVGHMFILLLLLIIVPAGELYLGAVGGGGANQQALLGLFLVVRVLDIFALVYYTHKYSTFVYLLLANFAITMFLAFALFEARRAAKENFKGGGKGAKNGKPSSSPQTTTSEDQLDTPLAVGMRSGTEDVSPIFAAQASRAAAVVKKQKKGGGGGAGRKSSSFSFRKAGNGGRGGGGNSLMAFNAIRSIGVDLLQEAVRLVEDAIEVRLNLPSLKFTREGVQLPLNRGLDVLYGALYGSRGGSPPSGLRLLVVLSTVSSSWSVTPSRESKVLETVSRRGSREEVTHRVQRSTQQLIDVAQQTVHAPAHRVQQTACGLAQICHQVVDHRQQPIDLLHGSIKGIADGVGEARCKIVQVDDVIQRAERVAHLGAHVVGDVVHGVGDAADQALGDAPSAPGEGGSKFADEGVDAAEQSVYDVVQKLAHV